MICENQSYCKEKCLGQKNCRLYKLKMRRIRCEYESRCGWSCYGASCEFGTEDGEPKENCSLWNKYRAIDLSVKLMDTDGREDG